MLKTRHWLLKIHHQANLCALPLLQRMESFIDLGGLFHIGSKANPILNLEVHYTLDTKREWKRCWYFSRQNHKAEVLRHRLFQRGMRLQWASITNSGSPVPMAKPAPFLSIFLVSALFPMVLLVWCWADITWVHRSSHWSHSACPQAVVCLRAGLGHSWNFSPSTILYGSQTLLGTFLVPCLLNAASPISLG